MGSYTGDCYIGVVGPDTEYGTARDSIHNIRRRPGDKGPRFIRATKGYEARQGHLNKFIASDLDFILLLDHDMVFAPDTLERLRAHKLPYVSGYYMRRRFSPMVPVWFEHNPDGQWPYRPVTYDPERDTLHRIGASGWGCILIHREVVLAVRKLLKGEWDVLEDDMDVWPYDLARIMRALKALERLPGAYWLGERELRRGVKACAGVLRQEIRPLRGKRASIVGSDIRFPFFAQQAGYQLWGDPDVRPGHVLHYPLEPDDFSAQPGSYYNRLYAETNKVVEDERREWRGDMEALR